MCVMAKKSTACDHLDSDFNQLTLPSFGTKTYALNDPRSICITSSITLLVAHALQFLSAVEATEF